MTYPEFKAKYGLHPDPQQEAAILSDAGATLLLAGAAAPHRRRGAALGTSPCPLRRCLPRRPTVDGPAPSVHLHNPYVAVNPEPCPAGGAEFPCHDLCL